MQFAKKLRPDIVSGDITTTIRFWLAPRVTVGNAYKLGEGSIVVEKISLIELEDVTGELARESGFSGVVDLLKIAKHGRGENIYFIDFRYVGPD